MPGQIIWYGKRWTLNDLTRIYWKLLSNCYPILGQICATTDRDGERKPDDKANAVDSTPGKTRIQMIYRIRSKCLSRLFFFYICATIILKLHSLKFDLQILVFYWMPLITSIKSNVVVLLMLGSSMLNLTLAPWIYRCGGLWVADPTNWWDKTRTLWQVSV